jgi:hypothetical protein
MFKKSGAFAASKPETAYVEQGVSFQYFNVFTTTNLQIAKKLV